MKPIFFRLVFYISSWFQLDETTLVLRPNVPKVIIISRLYCSHQFWKKCPEVRIMNNFGRCMIRSNEDFLWNTRHSFPDDHLNQVGNAFCNQLFVILYLCNLCYILLVYLLVYIEHIGADRFARDIELMMGRKVSKFVRICWCIFMTGFLTVSTDKPTICRFYLFSTSDLRTLSKSPPLEIKVLNNQTVIL